jgi:hypothetical protein
MSDQINMINLKADETEITITWTTINSTAKSTVWYGIERLNLSSHGTANKFIDGGKQKRHIFIHRVTLKGLTPGESYSNI